jgi:hypothetical protein
MRRKLNEDTDLYFQMIGELSMSMMVPSRAPIGIAPPVISSPTVGDVPTIIPTTTTKPKALVPSSKSSIKPVVQVPSPVQTPTVTNNTQPQTPIVTSPQLPTVTKSSQPSKSPSITSPVNPSTTIRPVSIKAPMSITVPASTPSKVPTVSEPTVSKVPTVSEPTLSLAPSISKQPSVVLSTKPTIPTINNLSDRPSFITSPIINEFVSNAPSEYPSTVPAGGVINESNGMIFRCANDGVRIVTRPIPDDIVSTQVEIKVVYTVEATGLLNTYRTNLDDKIGNLAVAGALQCLVTDPMYNITEALTVRTFNTGEQCTTQLNNTICSVLETNIIFTINQDVDENVAAFLAYIKIQENMNDSAFLNGIPNLSRIQYNRPLPLLPPIESSSSSSGGPKPASTIETSNNTTISASPWTLGVVVAMCKFLLLFFLVVDTHDY